MRAGLNVVLWVVGLALPLAMGFALPEISAIAPTVHPLVAFIVLGVVGFVAGLLLRAWHAPSLVPLAFVIGLVARLVAAHTVGAFLGLPSGDLSPFDITRVLLVAIAVLVVPLVLGTLVGVPLGAWLQQRLTSARRK
jgi:hypothetical protein